ncbi:Transcriptional regulator GlxA family, contains an amidase domain and an AraC-type DNA-binding HTH domain [Massilia sp. CF038]|nr:Transcriptional regulator GlxA family, contains an amidase domain and an AraC-type DNA-binding HTH domain [Massilia sp. CF038]
MEVFGLSDTLLLANRVAQALEPGSAALFSVSVISLSGGEIVAAGGLRLGTQRAPRAPRGLLVVPGMDLGNRAACLAPHAKLAPEVAYIARAFARGTRVAAVCVGAFLLGEAGLLDGRRATTSWMFAAELAQRFPAAKVDPAALLQDDGGVATTGSFSAAFDLALHFIGASASARVRRAVARMALLDERSSQAAWVDQRMLPRPAASFAANVARWLDLRLAESYHLATLAAAFHVSGRTLLRRFKDETGQSPLAYLQQARIGKAKLLLETDACSVAQVTEAVGYGDVATFGALFKRHVGHTPAEYRRRFRAAAGQ